MANLEYRLLDEAADFPVLYAYNGIDGGEIAARFLCDKFIKDGKVYERTSTASEPLTYVIYLREEGPAAPAAAPDTDGNGVRVEIRQDGESEAPGLLIETRQFTDPVDVILCLGSDYFYWLGDEWRKTMTVLDEDRKVYSYYAQKT
ncbi:hypothetical protein [Anaeroselena agilis]|uniref:Uncharacterized protein n=1 Tax=Anaeroselena agilis TaxID=3063788 RepID=A0ABU3P1H5_9FIRM|nr:hypothetical protein [Selenomonadales bacterium 4137-cl]